MASLRKKDRSPFWFACITLPDGRRVQRSTKELLRKPAQAKADEWERLSTERAKARQSHRVIADIYGFAQAEHGHELGIREAGDEPMRVPLEIGHTLDLLGDLLPSGIGRYVDGIDDDTRLKYQIKTIVTRP